MADDDATDNKDEELGDDVDDEAVEDEAVDADAEEGDKADEDEAGDGKAKTAKGDAEDEEDDDDEADPDDVEEDLDTILRDRIAAGADDDEDEEDDEGTDQPKRTQTTANHTTEEFSCPECFLMVRRSQFSARRTDCPGGLDGEDCPMKQRFI